MVVKYYCLRPFLQKVQKQILKPVQCPWKRPIINTPGEIALNWEAVFIMCNTGRPKWTSTEFHKLQWKPLQLHGSQLTHSNRQGSEFGMVLSRTLLSDNCCSPTIEPSLFSQPPTSCSPRLNGAPAERTFSSISLTAAMKSLESPKGSIEHYVEFNIRPYRHYFVSSKDQKTKLRNITAYRQLSIQVLIRWD